LPISAVDAITPAFEHAKHQLFRPFRFGQWARLALVGILAGELGSAGGCNFNFNWPETHHEHGSKHFLGASWPPELTHHLAIFAGVFAFGAVIGFGLLLVFMYISSRMRFVLFDSVTAKECHIRQGWARRRSPGFRLFVWKIWLMLASFAGLLVLVGIPLATVWGFGWFAHPKEHLVRLILVGVLDFLLLFVFMMGMALAQVMTKDFVVPQMAFEDISAVEGWRRLWPALKAETGGYAGYIGMKIVLGIGAGIAFGILTFIMLFLLLIPIGGLGVAAVLAGKAAGWTWNFHTIALAVFAGCIALAVLVFVASLVSVPTVVFFPAYSIYFFAGRYPPLAAALWPQATPPFAPASPGPESPPFPPSPSPAS